MYLPTSTFWGICVQAKANPDSISRLPPNICIRHFFNSLPRMYSEATCLHKKTDNFRNIPEPLSGSSTAPGQLYFHSVVKAVTQGQEAT